jgi:glycerophosphoryl diester phosphodiesterase
MSKNKDCRIIGHRGAAGIYFENTLKGIQTAIDLAVDCIEIDVWKTIDGEIVVFHDAYLDRLTGKSGVIREKTYLEVKALKLNNGDAIPTLKEIIEIVKKSEVQLLVEVKSEDAFDSSFALLKAGLPYSRFILGSFFHQRVMELKKAYPEMQTAIMMECVPVGFEEYLALVNPDLVVAAVETYDQFFIDAIKAKGKKLIFYTVDSKAAFELALRAAPFAIITNFPNLFLNGTIGS